MWSLHKIVFLWVSVFALLSAMAIQVATNLFNDAIDFKKGADKEDRIGPVRVTQSGLINERRVFFVANLFLLIALLLGVPLVLRGGLPILVVGIVSLFLAYGYTGGPYPLAYKGLGDLFVLLFFGLIATGGVYYLQSLTMDLPSLISGLQVGLLAAVLIAINNTRDLEQDARVNKKTLQVRLGLNGARLLIGFYAGLPFLLNFYWLSINKFWAFLLPLLLLPLALSLVTRVFKTSPSAKYNQFLAQSALLHLGFGLLLSLGLILG
jgi:1,4-dihydroxy-2-naphthoate octaprenyltransferase